MSGEVGSIPNLTLNFLPELSFFSRLFFEIISSTARVNNSSGGFLVLPAIFFKNSTKELKYVNLNERMSSRKRKAGKTKTIFFGLIILAALFGGFLSLWTLTLEIPDFRAFDERKVVQSTKIYDRTEKVLLFDVHGDVRRTVVPFAEIPRHMKNAVVAIEDSNFYNHNGIDLSGVFRAVVVNIFSGSLSQGGSTITQQLIKHALLTPEKTFSRKIKEAVLALKIEKTFGKEEILDFYLNEVPFGSSIYGVGSASQNFFAKPVEELTLAESAYLAALLKAPTYFP